MKHRFLSLLASLAVLPGLVVASSVVTDNNLTVTPLPDYVTTSDEPTSTSFALNNGSGLYSITTTYESTETGYNISPYYIAGVSMVIPPASTADLVAFIRSSATGGKPFPPTTASMVFSNTTAATTASYNLGIGRFDAHKAANYRWQTRNNTLYGAAGTDGNLVPNASFENADANFFVGGSGTVVEDGVHGGNAWQMNSAVSSYLALPVVAGTTYHVSFWYQNVTGSGQYEFGFSKPENGFTVGAGNTSSTINGLKAWTEVTATFTPTAGQNTWYLGGMSNGGQFQFDSISVSVAP